jgi:hypothetical protein
MRHHQSRQPMALQSREGQGGTAERRLRQIEEQRIASNTASTKKERQLKEMSALEEAELRVKDKALNAKLLAAEVRKEQMLLAKSTKLADRFEQLKMQSVMVMQSELEDAANLGKEVDKKLKTAHARKERKDKEMADALYAKNQANAVKFLEYLVSPDAQNHFANGNNEWPVVKGMKLDNPALKAMTGGNFKSELVPISAVGMNQIKVQQMLDRVGFK